MMPRFTVKLSPAEYDALKISASNELRDIRGQARYFIRQELERLGLLGLENKPKQTVQEPKGER
jgi:hypothetical protein